MLRKYPLIRFESRPNQEIFSLWLLAAWMSSIYLVGVIFFNLDVTSFSILGVPVLGILAIVGMVSAVHWMAMAIIARKRLDANKDQDEPEMD